ncbi:hypothetical protein SIN8267_03335 [Sinobacterium norvegicum]|uniref:Outer membrane protein beta-barrel domain-containing protein n=1 Tax=Sinobacterium norvegicum TaxID=1641715 RepID=A0ABN8ELD7_9GAMM|nr:hypothetical protein [Sinobacterium norvegicum]CAH0993194.1 hypothetical protein SIN8267_03335 [Sinobacterium norvegicum]
MTAHPRRIAAVLATAATLLTTHASASDWSYQAEIYLQGTNIKGDTTIGLPFNNRTTEVDLDSGDIFSNLDMGGMFRFEALNNSTNWGVMVDYAFMDLGPDASGPLGEDIDASIRQGVLEALAFKRFQLEGSSIDYFGGIRWWDNDIDLKFNGPANTKISVEEDWVDAVVGARWLKPLNERWTLMAKGDVGGFGLSSNFTSNLAVGAHYKMTDSLSLDLQYKAVYVDYETGSQGESGYFAYDTWTHGPIIGLIYNF